MAGANALVPHRCLQFRGGSGDGASVTSSLPQNCVRIHNGRESNSGVRALLINANSTVAVRGEGGGSRRRREIMPGVLRAQSEATMATVDRSSISSVIEAESQQNGVPVSREPDNDYLGLGSLLENGTLYRERFVVRFCEVGRRRTTSLETLSCLLQEAACNHVLTIGFGAFHGTNDKRLIAVTTRMHIEVDRYPSCHLPDYCRRSLLEIDTWFCTERMNTIRRDWTVKEVKTGEIIARATSTWVLMHVETKTMHRISDKLQAEFGHRVRDPPKWALSEQRRQTSSKRIPRLHGIAPYQKSGLEPIEGDFDMNLHVNNVKYITWTLESIPVEIKENYEVGAITLEYRREVGEGDKVDSLARPEPYNINSDVSAIEGSSQPQFIHLIRNQEGDEINKGRTVWRPVKHQAVQQGAISF